MIKKINKDGQISEYKTRVNLKKEGDHWVNEEVKIVKSVKCYVPPFLILVLKALTRKFPRDEFSIFCKFEYSEDNRIVKILPEYFIPKQRVTAASVEYDEGPPDGFKVVIHKHPNGCRSFSGTDDTYINQNHDVSMLWESNQFREGQIRVETPFGRIALSLEIESEIECLPNIPKKDLNKITQISHMIITGRSRNNSYPPKFQKGFNKYSKNNYRSNKGNIYNGFGKGRNNHSWVKKSEGKTVSGMLSEEQNEVSKFIADEVDDENRRYVDEIFEIMDKDQITWDQAELIYEANFKAEEKETQSKFQGGIIVDKKETNLQNINDLFEKNKNTRLPGAVTGSHTSIPGAIDPISCNTNLNLANQCKKGNK